MPKVSVVIPVYNVEKYLGECLDSVLRQTFKDLEIICVDDGSTDSSPKILAEYAAKDARIKIITQSNAGLSAARNAGMDAANGKYIYFLDSDDYITDDAMERCVEICERDGLDQLVFGCRCLFEDPAMDEATRRKKEEGLRIPEEVMWKVCSGPDLLKRLYEMKRHSVCVPFRVYRADMLRKAGLRFCAGRVHEDNYFTPLSLIESARVEVIGDEFYVRRYRPGSIVTKGGVWSDARRFASRIEIFRRHLREFSLRGYNGRHPALAELFFRRERERLVRIAKPMVAACALFAPIPLAGPLGRIGLARLVATTALRRAVRRIRRKTCTKSR